MAASSSVTRLSPLKRTLSWNANILSKGGVRGAQRFEKRMSIIYPHKNKPISWLHKSWLNEHHRALDLTKQFEDELGPEETIDYIWPMLIQQAYTAKLVVGAVDKGLFDNPAALLEVMPRFIRPLIGVSTGDTPPHWKLGTSSGIITSLAQPYANTVVRGMTHHIGLDFDTAFTQQLVDGETVLPQDWRNSYATVLAATEHTGRLFQSLSGLNSWSAGGVLLPYAGPGTVVRTWRDRAYVGYAEQLGLDIDEHVGIRGPLGPIVLKDPEKEILHELREMAKRDTFPLEIQQLIKGPIMEVPKH